ncbi:MAG: type III secretion system chaperone [Puniceicoccales bacterium]|nr:type III secretion system chaperone [Puniceicoccales bacterium]
MDYKKEVNSLLKELGKVLDLSSLELDINNHCLILFDDKIVLNLELQEERGALIVYSYISVVPFTGKELVLEILLEANFFWKASHGATFAIDKQTQTLILQQRFLLPIAKSENFQDELGIFVDVVEAWMKRIDDICSEAEILLEENLKTEKTEKKYGSWKY